MSEIRRIGAQTPNRVLNTVYFGGGTPSLMSAELVQSILDQVRLTWATSNSFEVTLEANPTSAEADRFGGYAAAGVNRLSMGFQAMNDADLRLLGRLHSVKEGFRAFEMAREAFDRVSFDLIYARQNQSLTDWQRELRQALKLSADHLSLYQLTIENGTAFGDRFARGLLPGLPTDDIAADMYFATQEICETAGLPAYEVSNHAREGAESRHNLIYWRGGDYAGIGPGAHGRLTLEKGRYAVDTLLAPTKWLTQVETTGSGDKSRQLLSSKDQAAEYLMMGLRVYDGIDLTRYQGLLGQPVNPEKLSDLADLGMVLLTGDRLKATPAGRPVLNSVIRELLPD